MNASSSRKQSTARPALEPAEQAQRTSIEPSSSTTTAMTQAPDPEPQPVSPPVASGLENSEKGSTPESPLAAQPPAPYYESTHDSHSSSTAVRESPKNEVAPGVAVATVDPAAHPAPAIVISGDPNTSSSGDTTHRTVPRITDPTRTRSWVNPFCGCFSPCDNCLASCFLPCMNYGKIDHRIKTGLDMPNFDPINGRCIAYGLLCCVAPCSIGIPTFIQRGVVRDRYKLDGNTCTDFLAACLCPCCTIAQIEKESINREEERRITRTSGQYSNRGIGMSYTPKS